MTNTNPIKRNESLKNVSRDHHFGLLFCWKLRTGLKNTELDRVKRYADHFYTQHLVPHFKLEEKYIFPLLGEESTLVQTAMDDHRKLSQLFQDTENTMISLIQIGEILEKHIRFEERVMFKELQRLVPEDKLIAALGTHIEKPEDDNWEDKFWERNAG